MNTTTLLASALSEPPVADSWGHYLTRFGTVGLAGIIVGVVLVNTLGNSLFKLGLGRMGARL